MRLPKLAIENHQFAFVLIFLIILLGLISIFTMPRSEDPQVSPAGSSVVVIYPGAGPADIEELVVDPIEQVLNELEDIKAIYGVAEDGLGMIQIEFLAGSDPDDKFSDVVQKVNSIRSELPEDIFDLTITKWTITDVKILQVAIISEEASYAVLRSEAERLKKSFEKTQGINKSETWAFPKQEVRVSVDLAELAQQKIPLNQVLAAIRTNNQNIPGGHVDMGSRRFNVQTSGSYQSISEIENTIIRAARGSLVRLKDVAEVKFDYEETKYHARYNGRRAVFVTAGQKERTNIFNVAEDLHRRLEDFKDQLPPSIEVKIVFDQSKSVSTRINRFFLNLLQGIVLVGFIIFLAVSYRAALIVMLVIPFSILIGLGFLDLSRYGLEQMSIAGLVIALGLLVDNAIVVTENIARFMRMGLRPLDAAVRGTEQIAWAIVSATATTVLAFVPMIMMRDITGDFIRSMPVTVVYTLSASLLLSLILTPYLSAKYIRVGGKHGDGRLRRYLDRLVSTRYRNALQYALAHPVTVLVIIFAIFFTCLGLFFFAMDYSYFPKAEKPHLVINIDTPSGSTLERTDNVASYVEKVLQTREEVINFATNIGHGNPRIYYNVIPKRERSTHAQIFVTLNTKDPDSVTRLIMDLRAIFAAYPGAEIELEEFQQGPPVESPVMIRIVGENLDKLKSIAYDIERIVMQTPGIINIDNPLNTSRTDLHVRINREKAGMFGLSLLDVDRAVRLTLNGLVVSRYRDDEGEEYNIVVRMPFTRKTTLSDLDRIYISSMTGAQVPLRQIAGLEFKATPMIVRHYNLDRSVTVSADVIGSTSVDKVTRQIIEKLEKYHWPKNYRYVIGGELESREESFGGLLQAIIIAMVGIFAVLVLQFRSYVQPLIVFSAIPFAIIGSIVALFVTGNSFSFTAFVGLTSLVGIVVNNSIILVDYANQLRREGTDLESALREAGETRFIPIILTTATTIGGLLPLTLRGGTLWAPMGWTIIGGLLTSTILTLIIVPALYKLFHRLFNA